jgi:hypothetical protein
MSIYDINISKQSQRLSPPDKRGVVLGAWMKALFTPLQWLADLWLGSYRTGSTAMEWLNTSTYSKYSRVVYTVYVYESLIDGNTATPTDTSKWRIVQRTFIGLNERLMYNTEKVVLEYALNKRFKTTFRQPPNVSDIYIDAHEKPLAVFQVGGIEINSSSVYSNTSSEFVIDSYSFTDYVNMTVNVPVAVFNALDAIPANCEKIIRSFIDIYIAAGITYTITTY